MQEGDASRSHSVFRLRFLIATSWLRNRKERPSHAARRPFAGASRPREGRGAREARARARRAWQAARRAHRALEGDRGGRRQGRLDRRGAPREGPRRRRAGRGRSPTPTRRPSKSARRPRRRRSARSRSSSGRRTTRRTSRTSAREFISATPTTRCPRDKDARVARARDHDLLALDSVRRARQGARPHAARCLRWMCFHRDVDPSTHYHFWTIPKRDGSRRTITAPKSELKAVQRWLLRNVFEKLPVHHAAHGFLRRAIDRDERARPRGRRRHRQGRREGLLPDDHVEAREGPSAGAPACPRASPRSSRSSSPRPPREIVQFRGKTLYVAKGPRACPQGAPTSPRSRTRSACASTSASSGLARTFGFTYTRYADDLAFSWQEEARRHASRPSARSSMASAASSRAKVSAFTKRRRRSCAPVARSA